MKTLLPCPFCGGDPEIKQTGKNKLKIRCKSCQVNVQQAVRVFPLEWLEERMIENWNKRESQFREPSTEQSEITEDDMDEAFKKIYAGLPKQTFKLVPVKSTEQSGGTEQEKKILESHFGSDFYQLKEHRFLPHIISAMKEHAGIVAEQAFLAGRSKTSWSQFKKDMNHTRKP